MLLLLFQCGTDRYGLDISRVIEVAPLATLTRVPHAPEGMAGLLNYRGGIVPVIDLAYILTGAPSRARLSTRIIVMDVSPEQASPQIVGFVAERATETIHYGEEDLQASGVTVTQAPYLGKIALDQHEMIQCIDPTVLLPESLKKSLFALAKESAHA